MGIDIQIYLTEVPLPPTPLCPPFDRPSALLSSSVFLSLSLSLALILFDLRVLPMTKTVTRNRCELPCGVGSESGEKEFASRFSLFFLLPFDHRYSRADLERKPRRQMRASTRGNCTSLSLSSSLSSIFRAVFPSLGSLDLKEGLVSRYNVLRGE